MPTAARTRRRPRSRARRVDADPTLGTCFCGAPTLTLMAPGPVVCEPWEAVPAFDCPNCVEAELRGQARTSCWRCGGSRRIGVEGDLPEGVALDENDRARYFDGEYLCRGEALYALHACGSQEAIAA